MNVKRTGVGQYTVYNWAVGDKVAYLNGQEPLSKKEWLIMNAARSWEKAEEIDAAGESYQPTEKELIVEAELQRFCDDP